jgi:CheY-like chemotaxis protein
MGGDIHIVSRRGAGSTFSFELNVPVVAPLAVDTAPEWAVSGYKGPRKSVLVVDDVMENRAVAVNMLGQIGFETAEAVNGLDALEKIQALRPALVLMDIVMPGMDGLEVTRRLRQMQAFRDLPIIAISASASGSDAAKSLAAGANAFLPKPVDYRALLSQIAKLLDLEWSDAIAGAPPLMAGTLIAPPPDEIKALHHLARLGDMRAIVQHAAHLNELDERYRPFADHLYQLAKHYRSKAVLSFVEHYLERKPVA